MPAKKTSPAVIATQQKTTTSGVDDENIALRRINQTPKTMDKVDSSEPMYA
jgi:hypothetical protein